MSVTLRYWSEDGDEETVNVSSAQLLSQIAPQPPSRSQKPPPATEEKPIKWTIPDNPPGDFA
ncbi:hypothetical protein [Cupriavidus basilensis]|uniref:Uncharacterized protein n=1 Tax=Cupriavidus basilensis TaxID=68895 RepID=A0A643FZP8_9BURK|nr:hypothetical protein [Cupriavidus basilensis]MCP3021697.1 hypothetical protein [Cupriavidus basilensis]QOT81091.1 hypothetical protein F7R26_027445 [Cupriavidus basilensis]